MSSFVFPSSGSCGTRQRTSSNAIFSPNFIFNNPSTYYGYGKIEREGNIVNGYYSDDLKTWLYVSTFTLSSSSQVLSWGLYYSTSQNGFINSVSFRFDYLQTFGILGTNCRCNLVTTSSSCITNPTLPLECSTNSWRYAYSVTAFDALPSITVGSLSLSISSGNRNTQKSPITDEETIFVFKEITGDGSIRTSFNPSSNGNFRFNGLQIREVPSNGSWTLTRFNTYQCVLPNLNNMIANKRMNTVASQNVSNIITLSRTYFLKLEKFGNDVTCDFSFDGISWINIDNSKMSYNTLKLHVGIISNSLNSPTQTFGDILYTGFNGFCSNNHISCGVSGGVQDKCICKPGYFGTICETHSCNNILPTNSSVCNSQGVCQSLDNCTCKTGYTGQFCQFPICYGISSNNTSVCRGNGKCEKPDTCVCNSGYGDIDCIPICNGTLSNNATVCSSQGICSAPNTCICNSTFSGDICQFPICYQIPSNNNSVCSSSGRCLSPNNCVCTTGYIGQNCQFPVCFGLPSNDSRSCSGNGTCISYNNCSCNSGYGGFDCSLPICNNILSNDTRVCNRRGNCYLPNTCSCNQNYYGNDCQNYNCSGVINSSPLVCNSQGRCLDYNSCSCNSTYIGENCQFPICFSLPSNNTSVCNQQGNCTAPNTCICNSNYTGSNCQFPVCFGFGQNNASVCSSKGNCTSPNNCLCSSGYTGPNCQFPICYGIPSNDSRACTGNGTCVDTNVCSCNSGYGGFDCSLPICNNILSNDTRVCNRRGICYLPNTCSCNQNYYGNDCQNFNCYGVINNISSVCNSQGICLDYNNCSCNSNYTGFNCQFPYCFGISSNNNSVCNSQGNCTAPNICSCNSNYTGDKCQFPVCFGVSSINSSVCSSQGNCTSPNNCICSLNYTGPNCQFPICYGFSSNDSRSCRGNGICNKPNNCSCFNGFGGQDCLPICQGKLADRFDVCNLRGNCISPNLCNCSTNYYGNDCQNYNCSGVINSSPLVCNSQGRCLDFNNCSCNSTYTGDSCQFPICFNIPSNNNSVCNSQGICTSPNTCICNSSYTGDRCQFPLCSGIPSNNSNVCSSKGSCISPNECRCIANRSGLNCEFSTCSGINSTDPNVCLTRGVCIDSNNCTCNSNYTGNNCQFPICYGIYGNDPNVCSANGICVGVNNCTCFIQNRGLKCESFRYYWRNNIDGSWSNSSNWLVKIDGVFQNTQRPPLFQDEIYLDKEGNYTVLFDVQEDYKILHLYIGDNSSSSPTLKFVSNRVIIEGDLFIYSKGAISLVNTTLTTAKTKIFGKIGFQNNDNPLLSSSLLIQKECLFEGDIETSLFNTITFNTSITITKATLDTSKSTFNFLGETKFVETSKLLVKTISTFNFPFIFDGSSILEVRNQSNFNSAVVFKSNSIIGSDRATFNAKTTFSSSTITIQTPMIYNNDALFENGDFNIENYFEFNSQLMVLGNLNIKRGGIIKSNIISGSGTINVIESLILNQNGMSIYPKLVLEGSLINFNNINIYGQVNMIKTSLIDQRMGTFNLNNDMNMNTLNTTSILGDGIFSISSNASLSRSTKNNLFISAKLINNGIIRLESTSISFLNTFSVTSSGRISLDQSSNIFIEGQSNMNVNSNAFIGNGNLQVSANANLMIEALTPLIIQFNINQKGIIQFRGSVVLSSRFDFSDSAQLDVFDNSFVTLKGTSQIFSTQKGFTGFGAVILDPLSFTTFYSPKQIIESKLIVQSQNVIFQSGNHEIKNSVILQASSIKLEKDSIIHFTNCEVEGKDNIFNGEGIINIRGIVKWKGAGTILNFISNLGSIIIDGVLTVKNLNISSSTASIQGGRLKFSKESKVYLNQGNLNSLIIDNDGIINIFGSNSRINSTIINNNRIIEYSGLRTIFINSQIINQGIFNQIEGSIISQSQNSIADTINPYSFINNGEINLIAQNNIISFLLPFENNAFMNLRGAGVIELNPILKMNPFCTFTLKNITLKVDQQFNVTNGNFFVSGKIITPIFTYSSNTGVMRMLDYSSSLYIDGNFTLSVTGFIFIQAFGLKDGDQNKIYVSGHSNIEGLVYVKLGNNYAPSIGDVIPFLESPTYFIKELINLIGAVSRSAKYKRDRNKVGFEIIFSIGAADSAAKYDCHYLGNRKILEFVSFDENNGVSLTFTAPGFSNTGWIGFGFDFFGNISTSNMIISSNGSTFEVNNHFYGNSTNSKLLDFSSNYGETIFKIGEPYYSISVFLQKSSLSNQTKIYYAEGNEIAYSNTSHFYVSKHTYSESFDFSINNHKSVIDCTNYLAPTRREIYSMGASIFLLIFYVIITIISLIFHRYQPLASRGISPYFTLGFLFAQLLLEFRNLAYITPFQGSLCFHFAYGIFPLMQVCFIIIFLYFMRYFAIINFNNAKNNATSREKRISLMKIRFLKLLASSWFIFIILFIFFVVVNIVFTIILAADGFICRFKTLIALKSVNNAQLIIIYTLTLFLLLGDVIANYEQTFIKCQWWKFITDKDPYYFRIQIVLFIPFMIYNLITEIIAFAYSLNYRDQIIHHLEITIYYTITYTVVLIIDVLFPLIITIILLVINLIRKKPKNGVILNLLSDLETEKMFLNFAKKEFSIENVICYQDIQLFKKKKKDAKEIYENYFSGSDALYEVNVPRNYCNEVLNQIKNDKIELDLFDKLEKTILTNLNDTYSRFYHSKDYQQYLKNNKFKKELIEGNV